MEEDGVEVAGGDLMETEGEDGVGVAVGADVVVDLV